MCNLKLLHTKPAFSILYCWLWTSKHCRGYNKSNEIQYNPAYKSIRFQDSQILQSFLLWLFRVLYWDSNLLSRWHQLQLKKLRKTKKTWKVHQLNHFCKIFGLNYTSLSPLYKINSWTIDLSLTSQISMTWTA